MDKLNQMRVFVRVAERAHFSVASREMHVTQSTVSRAVTALERSLGVRLVNRNTRTVSLTEAGARYYERCRAILADLDEAEAILIENNRGAVGLLKISAPVPFGLMFISTRIIRFQQHFPQLKINLNLTDQQLNLVEENIDVAFRLGHLTQPNLVVRKIGESPIVMVATPAYLSKRGVPQKPKDLVIHNCLIYTLQDNPRVWSFYGRKSPEFISITSYYESNNLLSLKDAATAGVGIARLPLWMVDAEVKSGTLHRVLDEYPLPALDINAVFPTAQQIPSKVRLLVDFMQEELNSIPYFQDSVAANST